MVKSEAIEAVCLLDLAPLVKRLGNSLECLGDGRNGFVFRVVIGAVGTAFGSGISDGLCTSVGDVLRLGFAVLQVVVRPHTLEEQGRGLWGERDRAGRLYGNCGRRIGRVLGRGCRRGVCGGVGTASVGMQREGVERNGKAGALEVETEDRLLGWLGRRTNCREDNGQKGRQNTEPHHQRTPSGRDRFWSGMRAGGILVV